MNLIFFSRRQGRTRHVNLGHPLTVAALALVGVGLLFAMFWSGMRLGASRAEARQAAAATPAAMAAQQAEIAALKQQLQERADALSLRMGQLDAQLLRLNAAGKRLVQSANIDSKEFDFDHDPPRGGPEDMANGRSVQLPELGARVGVFERSVTRRTAQYLALENVLMGRKLSADIRPTGKPVRFGYMSSGFGERMDPFSGEEAVHKGIDFAADAGSDVLAVAQGVVTWAGPRAGYGVMVELTHGNGLVTRYAHNARVTVKVGDTVDRGQVIAVVGSTGRSTGPHVHFEVLRGGAQIDPQGFVGN